MDIQLMFNAQGCSDERAHLIKRSVTTALRKHFAKTDASLGKQLPENDWKDTCGYLSCFGINGLEDFEAVKEASQALSDAGIGFDPNFGTDFNTGECYIPSSAVLYITGNICHRDDDVLRANFASELH